MITVSEAIKQRSSTRGYKPEPISDEQIKAVIEAGLQAPTAANRQEIHFTVIDGASPILKEIEDEKNNLRKITDPEHNFYYEAPTVIILSADSGFHWGALDAGIAVENMALTAEGLGLGNLIIGCIYDALRGDKKQYFSEKLKFPENYEYEIAIAIGYKNTEKEPHTYDADKQVTWLR